MTRIIVQTTPERRRRTPWRSGVSFCTSRGAVCQPDLDGRCIRCREMRHVAKLPGGILPSAALAVRI
jgi:hypothetical protein